MKQTHVMLDLETMSTEPNAASVAIGAVAFNEDGDIHGHFYASVTLESSMSVGGHVSASTIEWWMKQSNDAREVFLAEDRIHISEALLHFRDWFIQNKGVYLWGNGAAFDNVVLRSAYTACDHVAPWEFWNDRCYRTVKAMHPHIKAERVGTHHNALDDARTQMYHLLEIWEVKE